MAYAVRHRMIDYNPVRDAERPRSQGKEGQEKEISVLTPEQIRNFLKAVTDQKYKTLFLTAIMTGARQGEVLGLKWSDVDFQKKQISINRTFNMGRFFTPKTKGSARRIDLSPMAVKALAEWKMASGGQADANYEEEIKELQEKEQALMAQSTGAPGGDIPSPALHQELTQIRAKVKRLRGAPLVFPNESGEPMNYSNMVQRYYRKALKDAGIPQIRFHDLRHTYASLLLSQGENVKYIQTQMGHSSPTVTLNVYAHLMKGENQEAACRLENTIFSVNGSKTVAADRKGAAV
jgi:integrase